MNLTNPFIEWNVSLKIEKSPRHNPTHKNDSMIESLQFAEMCLYMISWEKNRTKPTSRYVKAVIGLMVSNHFVLLNNAPRKNKLRYCGRCATSIGISHVTQ